MTGPRAGLGKTVERALAIAVRHHCQTAFAMMGFALLWHH